MSRRAHANLAELLQARDRGWARVTTITWLKSMTCMEIAIDTRRGGALREMWRVECKGVREYRVTDVNGGGLAVYDDRHPVVRQHVDDVTRLDFRGTASEVNRLIGDLVRAHCDATDDWIEFDAYLGNVHALVDKLQAHKGTLATGPAFLMDAYAEALRGHKLRPRSTTTEKKRRRAMALHFGHSFIVASSIVAKRAPEREG